jgi:hypothetical protein
MRRSLVVSLVIAAGLIVSACGGAKASAHKAALIVTIPTTTTTLIDPACYQNAPTDGCPLGSPAVVAWAQQQDAEAQAAQLPQTEQQYAACLNNIAQALADALDQKFSGATPAKTPPEELCSTAGLTPTEVQQIRTQVFGPTQSSTTSTP